MEFEIVDSVHQAYFVPNIVVKVSHYGNKEVKVVHIFDNTNYIHIVIVHKIQHTKHIHII